MLVFMSMKVSNSSEKNMLMFFFKKYISVEHGEGTDFQYFRYCSVDLGTETCFTQNTNEVS